MDDDLALLRAWQSGNDAAGSRLVRRHIGSVYRFLANKLDDGIEDLAQQTFAACLRNATRFQDGGSFRAYLLGTARHVLFHHYRKHLRASRAADLERVSVESTIGSPSRVLAADEQRRALLAALRRLPLAYQTTLELYYWEELSTPEIAIVLETTEGTVRSRLTRGRALLRDVLANGDAQTAALASTPVQLDAWARSLRDTALPRDTAASDDE